LGRAPRAISSFEDRKKPNGSCLDEGDPIMASLPEFKGRPAPASDPGDYGSPMLDAAHQGGGK
jgi:hypothetical protein